MRDHCYNNRIYDLQLVEIQSIELVEQKQLIDIQVAENNVFFANGILVHNSAAESQVVTTSMIADSFKKVMHSDFVISASRTMEDKVQGTARVSMLKSRQNSDGITFMAQFNSNNGKLEIFPPNTDMHFETKKKMDNKQTIHRQILSQRIKEIQYNGD